MRSYSTVIVFGILAFLLIACASFQLSGEGDSIDLAAREIVQLGHSREINSVSISPDGRTAVSGGSDGTIKLWEVSTGREIKTFYDRRKRLHRGVYNTRTGGFVANISNVNSVAFSPNGRFVLSGSSDGVINLWDIRTGDSRVNADSFYSFRGGWHYTVEINSLAFSPDGRFVLSGDSEGTIKLRRISNLSVVRRFNGHSRSVNSVVFSPDGSKVLSGSSDGTMRIWDSSTGRQLSSLEAKGKITLVDKVNSVAFSPDGRFILSGSSDGSMRLWNAITGNLVRVFELGSEQINIVVFSPDGRFALAGGGQILKIWEISTGKEVRTFREHPYDTKFIFSKPFGADYIPEVVKAAVFSPDSRFILSSRYNVMNCWEVSTGRKIQVFKGHAVNVSSVALSPDGSFALSKSRYNINLWDIISGRLIRTVRGRFADSSAVSFSPDGKYIHLKQMNGTVRRWELFTGRETKSIQEKPLTPYLTLSSDERFAIIGGEAKAKLLKFTAQKTSKSFLVGHAHNINCAAFSKNSQYALTGSMDNTIKLWKVSGGTELMTLRGHTGTVSSIAFSPNGLFAISGSMDTTTRIWDLTTGKEIVKLIFSNDEEWIIATPDGYYNNSLEGASLIHWAFQGGIETFTYEQFESNFKRSDIIKARLSGNIEAGIPGPAMIRPPHIEMIEHSAIKKTSSKNYLVQLTASALEEVKTVRVFVNGKPILEVPVNATKKELFLDLPLFSGANRITAVAYDEKGFSSNPKFVDVLCKDATLPKPNLHILGIGISEYSNLSAKWQLDFAHTDAKSLIKAFQNQDGKLFGEVNSNYLTNRDASVENITRALEALNAIDNNDVAVIFMAGHGVKAKNGTFYFMTSSGNFENPQNGGLSWTLLGDYLSKIKGRVILFLDACHSGSIVNETIVPNDALAQKFFTGTRGGIMVFSASKGRQYSMESPDFGGGFGIFTYALTQGMVPMAAQVDISGNGFVEFMELVDYVRAYVVRVTNGEQTPWLSRKELFGDLPLAVVE